MKYIIIEIQTATDETISTLVYTADDYNHARSIFHEKLAAAAISSVPIHAVIAMDANGNTIGQESYRHEEVGSNAN